MVPGGGFEPPTRGFSIRCSTPELPGRDGGGPPSAHVTRAPATRCPADFSLLRHHAHRAAGGAGREGGVGAERRRDLALARRRGLPAGVLLRAGGGGRARRRRRRGGSCRFGMSISIRSPSWTRPIVPPSAASGETWPIERPERAAGEAAVGDERAGLAEALRLQVARRVEHLLHARAAARALVADQRRRRRP